MARAHWGDARQAVLARELTKRHETVLAGTLAALCNGIESDTKQQKGEFVVLVAGAEPPASEQALELQRVLQILLDDMSVKRAAVCAAQICGVKKNAAYQLALTLKGQG